MDIDVVNKLASQLEDSKKTTSSIWHVLGCMPTTDKSKVQAAFKKMALVYHPDHGGSSQAFQILVNARDKALEKCK